VRPPFAILAAVLLAILAPGCRRIEALKQRCVSGDLPSCESACSKGIAGEGGCFHAGDQHRTRASREGGESDLRRAAEFFVKSCNGGYADGCLFAAQMIEAPYAAFDLDGAGKTAPKRISDTEIVAREKWLSAACKEGSIPGCKRLGDVLIGKDDVRALKAYEKACRAGSAPEECAAARSREAALAERWRAACTHHVADDCTRLGNLLFALDVPRAMRLFVSECELRGVAELSGGLDSFVRQRVKEARMGVPLAEEPGTPSPPLESPAFHLTAPVVAGSVAFVEIERWLRLHEPDLASCLATLPKEPDGKIAVRLVVDLTGDVFRATATPNRVPERAAICVQAKLEALALRQPPPDVSTIDFDVVIGAPAK
jgi:hypothetical protein